MKYIIGITFACFFLPVENMATRKFRIIYVAHIVISLGKFSIQARIFLTLVSLNTLSVAS